VLPILCALAFALVALVAIPASSSAFGISGFSYTQTQLYKNSSKGTISPAPPTPTQAGAHPNVSISFNRTGAENEDLQNVLLDLPTGVFPNPENGAKCNGGTPPTSSTANYWANDTCAATTQVGNVSMDIKAASILSLTAPGTINMLTPDPGQVATLGITVRPAKICILFIFCAVPDKVYLKTGITVKTYEDSGLRTYTPGAPHTTSIAIPPIVKSGLVNLDITVNKLTLNFQSRYNATNAGYAGTSLASTATSTQAQGTGNYFWTNTTGCDLATAKVDISSYSNQHALSSASFTPTGCPAVPFAPTVSFVPPKYDPALTPAPAFQAGGAGPVQFKLNIPEADATIQNSLPKLVDVDFPVGSGLDLNALSGVTACTEDQLKASACPASSIIGTANAFSKYLPATTITNPLSPGLTGNIYAMSVSNQIDVGVQLIGPRNTIVIFRGTLGSRGDANAGTGRVYSLFNRIPQLPFSQFTLNIAKPVYKNPETCGSNSLSTALTGFSGATASQSGAYNTGGCSAAPNTTITNGPPSTTTNPNPTFTFTSSINSPAPTFACKNEAGSVATAGGFTPCTSPFTIASTLADGTYTFSVAASNGLTPDASPATATYTVARAGGGIGITATVTPSSTVGAAHPDLTSTVNITGGQPKSVSIKLPSGFNASLTAVPSCLVADAALGNCAAASKIGTLQLTANTFSGPVTGVGDVFLTAAPTGADAGGIAVKVPLGGLGTFIAQGGANLVNNGNNQNVIIRDFPTNVGGTDITVTQLVLGLSGANRFLTNPSNCTTTDGFKVDATGFDGSAANPVVVAFQATGCPAAIPFAPTFNLALSSVAAGSQTGITATLDVPQDNSTVKTLRVTLPPGIGPNFPAFGDAADQCPSSAAPTPTSVFNPAVCPAQSLVGSMNINTPLLPTVLHGDVYLINKSPLPWFGVKFDQPGISIRLTGVTSTPQVDPLCDASTGDFCQSQISAVFNNLPDTSLSHVVFNLDGPTRTGVSGPLSGKLLVVATPGDATCAAGPAKSTITPHSGGAASVFNQTIAITGC
jgi:hypothetical protein